MAAHVFNAREVRETGAGEQPGAMGSRDSDSYLQLLASPLVSRSPSPGSMEDPEEIPDVNLEDDQPMAEEEGVAEVITLSSESEDDGGETVTPEVSSDEDETARKARARMAYRSIRRATQGQGRICLGVTPPTGDPAEARRFMEARVTTLRRLQQMVDARRAAAAETAWQERLARLQEEEEALWAPTTEQPEPTQPPLPLTPPPPAQSPPPPPPRMAPAQSPPPPPPRMTAALSPPPPPPRMTAAQSPPPTPPRPPRTPATPPPQPRSPTPPPQQGEWPRYDRQQAWEMPQAHVGQVVRTFEMGGRLWHQQSVTWTWPASEETEDAPEARVWKEAEAIGWRMPGQESRDPRLRARAREASPEKEGPKEESPGVANPEKEEWSWPAPGEAPPPPKLPRQMSCPEARQPPPRPCPCRQASLDGQKWREVPTEDWPPQVAEEAARQGTRKRRGHWAKLFELGGQRYRLKVRRGGEVRVTVAE
ncbi:serine/arginine repetitive matrix protein 1-like [Drosophila simulans]|uniref:serine/arginine repetitive matrix protein 1-like n=1 Tax=Drosophila simulans TaxID=7240 RepID=UPI001D113AC5|nr:serine/arginine repetitive matrix protein 1-like [Drosophila simulans]